MNIKINRICFVFWGLVFCFFSCEKQKNNKNEVSFSKPTTIVSSNPKITLLDTCSKPVVMEIPSKGSRHFTIPTNNGNKIITLATPIVKELPMGEAGGYTFMQNFNTEQGLALSSISCGYKDKIGNLWFGTPGGGVSKYDGKSFTNFTSSQGLANNLVRCVIEDKIGNMWFGTSTGLSKFDGKYFENFTTEQGLVNNSVSSITEDESGNLWFSTQGGISKYETDSVNKIGRKGKLFKNFTIAQGLLSNGVVTSIIDKKGNLWFGTNQGISKYNSKIKALPNGKFFTNYTTAQGLNNNSIMSITEDKVGNLWFGALGGGVSKYNPTLKEGSGEKDFANYSIGFASAHNTVYCITEDKMGNIWFGTDLGMSRYSRSFKDGTDTIQVTNFTIAQGLSSNAVRSITEDKTGSLWIGTSSGGLSKFDGKSFTSFKEEQGLASYRVWDMAEDKSRNLWFATGNGVSKYSRKSRTNGQAEFTNFSLHSSAVMVDKKGNVWFGSGFGAIKYDGKSFTNYNTTQGLVSNSITSIVEDKTGNIWFGTYGGISKYDGNRVEEIESGENVPLNNQQDLIKINGKFVKSFTNYTTKQGLAGNAVKCIIEDKMGNMWFGTSGNGVSKFDGQKSSSRVMNGSMSNFTNFSRAQGLPNNSIYSILEDKAGTLWFGTAGGGVSRYNPSVKCRNDSMPFTTFTASQGLANDMVYAMVEDTLENIIWCGTNLGLSGLKLNSLSLGTNEAKFENFNNNTGYPIKDLNTGALFMDKQGIIWAGTGDKLLRFDYKAVHKSAAPPTVFIRRLKIQGENVSWSSLEAQKLREEERSEIDSLAILNEEIITYNHPLTEMQHNTMHKKFRDLKFDSVTRFYPIPQNLVLPYENNNITFDFVAIETSRPLMVNYQYMLDGYDREWSPLTNSTSATFGNIHEGTYIFKLKAQSPDGIWSIPITYTFEVSPPVYRTWWAYSFYLTAGSSLLFGVYRLRTRSLRRDKEILEQTVKERTSEVVLQKNIVEEKNIKITDSINYAKRIQYAILPPEELIKSFFPDSFIFFRPKDIVSGDFYWFSEREHKLIIAVADCTGHGVPGAFMSMIGNTLLNEIVNVKNINEPNRILNELNKGIVTMLRQSSDDSTTQDDGMDITILSIDKINGEMEFAGANHFSYIFNDNQLKKLNGDVFSIGGMFGRADITFLSEKVKIENGCTIFLFTDGFIDQFGGEKNTKFLSSRFEQLLQNIQHHTMEEQHELLIAAFDDWKGNHKQLDDVTIVGIRF